VPKTSRHADGGQTVRKEIHVNLLIKVQIVVFFHNVPKEMTVNSTINRRLTNLDLITIGH